MSRQLPFHETESRSVTGLVRERHYCYMGYGHVTRFPDVGSAYRVVSVRSNFSGIRMKSLFKC